MAGNQPSKYAVHPNDNTSDVEPDQPGIASNLNSNNKHERQISQAGKTVTTFKSQDDIEPEMPAIGSEFQSNKYEEEPHN